MLSERRYSMVRLARGYRAACNMSLRTTHTMRSHDDMAQNAPVRHSFIAAGYNIGMPTARESLYVLQIHSSVIFVDLPLALFR